MAIASGTCGTCSWTISDAGVLTIGAGTLHAPWWISSWPWLSYADQIKSAVISNGVVVGKQENIMGGYQDTYNAACMFTDCANLESVNFQGDLGNNTDYINSMFSGCTKLTSVNIKAINAANVKSMNGLFKDCSSLASIDFAGFNTANVEVMSFMFNGCSSLTALDLSSFDTRKLTNVTSMFYGCDLLTSIKFGSNFATPEIGSNGWPYFVGTLSGFKSASNSANGIVVLEDPDFCRLTKAEHEGTWTRSPGAVTYKVEATRNENGQGDDDGEDVKITTTWATGATTTDRILKIYKKAASDASYPASPETTQNLSGNSGITEVILQNVGDASYDFRVEFYDGTETFIAFPSVQSNIRLVEIDGSGNMEVLGTIKSNGNEVMPLKVVENANANSLTDTGLYHVKATLSNFPRTNWGLLIVQNFGTPFQLYFPDATAEIWRRHYSGSAWTSWLKVTFS